MCGIAGLVNFSGRPVEVSLIKAMTDSIAHRGPDGEGHWVEGAVGLGHRRLAIIDTSPVAGQPMISLNGRFVLSYNGEVYNFREIRRELEQSGIVFRTRSDTEVVLEALALWGHKAVSRFNGMFAFALWDRQEATLLIARDRYGIKPLYWAMDGNHLAFASENKAILVTDRHKRNLDTSALTEYLTFQNYFTDRTLLEGVHLLPPGTIGILKVGTGKPTFKQTQYWDFDFQQPNRVGDENEYIEELERLLMQAVERQLISDVELGTYLSGGIDSGSIAGIASRNLPNLKSFTCGFDLSSASGLELGFDERTEAEFLSASFKTEHYEMVLKSGDMERCMKHLIWHLEEPRVGQSYPNFYASKLASRFVKVVLAGTGGDELFGGYPWRYFHSRAGEPFSTFVNNYYQYWQRLLDDFELRDLLGSAPGVANITEPRKAFDDFLEKRSTSLNTLEDQLNASLYLEAKTFLHGLLIVEDKLSMAHSLEARVPFLDNDLVDFAMKCPASLKVRATNRPFPLDENLPGSKEMNYQMKSDAGKNILRKATEGILPEQIRLGRKQGFSAPDASWFRGESIDFVRSRILGRKSQLSEVLDFKKIEVLVDDHLSGRKNRRLLIWSLLCLEEWLEAFN